MKSIEIEGRSKDEAIAKGLASLELSRAQVSVEVIEEGGRGFLGLGNKPVKVRLRQLDEGEVDPGDVVRNLLELMEVEFELQVSQDGEETNIRIDAPKDDGLLIGRRGQTLDALRHISQRIVAARKGQNVPVNIDVGDYRARREAGLVEKAEEAASQVLEEGRALTLDPMSAQDRRVVHLALAEREDVVTHTVGHGSRRRVVIAPADEVERGDETAYDRVPDPGFRSRRLVDPDRPDPGNEAQPRERREEGPREERPPRRRGRDRGPRRGRRREGGDDSQGERPNERREGGHRREGRDRNERDRNERGRGDSRRRGRDRDDRRPERRDRRDDDRGFDQPDGPAARSKEDLSKARVVGDDSPEKAFPSDVAKRILQLDGGGGSGSSGKRRKRR